MNEYVLIMPGFQAKLPFAGTIDEFKAKIDEMIEKGRIDLSPAPGMIQSMIVGSIAHFQYSLFTIDAYEEWQTRQQIMAAHSRGIQQQ